MTDLVAKLIMAGRILEASGQRDYTRGHVSARLPDDPQRFIMKPQTFGLEEITPENVVTCDLTGAKVGGAAPRHSEVFIHSAVLARRPDLNAVIHTHPVHAVAFTALGQELAPIGQPSTLFWRGLPMFDGTMELIADQATGDAVAACLGDHKAMLLRNHGVVVAGESIEEAVYLALLLEDACRLHLLAASAGGARAVFPPSEVRALGERLSRSEASRTTFEYLARSVTRTNSRDSSRLA